MNHVEYGETVLRTGESVHPHIVLVHFSIPVTITCAVSASCSMGSETAGRNQYILLLPLGLPILTFFSTFIFKCRANVSFNLGY